MTTTEIKLFLNRSPFRPFAFRLKNGSTYTFNEPRDIHSTRDARKVFWFGPHGQWVMFEAEAITEIIE